MVLKIDSITIPKAESRSKPDSHIVYLIEAATKSKSWSVYRRYSDFDELNEILKKRYKVVLDFPPKKTFGNKDPSLVERRRIALERFLKAIIVAEDKISQSPEFLHFIEADQQNGKVSSTAVVSSENWLEVYGQLETIANQISVHAANREKMLQRGESDGDEGMQARKKLAVLTAQIAQLADQLNADDACENLNITEKELLRRRDLLAKLRTEKDRLDKWIKNPRLNAGERNELIGGAAFGGASSSRGPRRFGPEETEATKNLDNEGVIGYNQQLMQKQDEQLDSLLSIITRQKAIGQMIGDELDLQNKMLDELSDDVDNVKSKMGRAHKKVIKLM